MGIGSIAAPGDFSELPLPLAEKQKGAHKLSLSEIAVSTHLEGTNLQTSDQAGGQNENDPKFIKKLLHESGRAELLVSGDWRINRGSERLSEKTGLVSLEEQELLLLKFLKNHGLLKEDEKLTHFHPGCGNGFILETLRNNPLLFEGKPVSEYFEQIGLVDKFYFTLPDLLTSLLKPEYQDNPILAEFIEILSVLILRRSHFDERYNSSRKDEKTQKIIELPYEINNLRYILKNLRTYFPRIAWIDHLDRDGEFVGSAGEKPISEDCQKLLRVFANSSNEIFDLWNTYFQKDLFNPRKDLAEEVTFYEEGVILGLFQNLNEILGKAPQILGLTNIHRASSHLDNVGHKNFMKDLNFFLMPGFYIDDDGFLESYTRDSRISELMALQKELGDEYKISVVCDEERPKTVILQRGFIEVGEEQIRFRSKEEETELLSGEDNIMIPIEEFPSRYPEQCFKNAINRILKGYFVEEPTNKERIKAISREIGKDPQLVYWDEVVRCRQSFEKLHKEVDVYLQEFFQSSRWQDIKNEDVSDGEMSKLINWFFDNFIMRIDVVRKRVNEVVDGTICENQPEPVQ